MSLKTVNFQITVPECITDEQLEDYLRYELDFTGSCSCDNPLVDGDLDQLNPAGLSIY